MLLTRPFSSANISFPVGENGVDLMECYCYEKEGGNVPVYSYYSIEPF